MLARTSTIDRLLLSAAGLALATYLLGVRNPVMNSAAAALVGSPRINLPDSLVWNVSSVRSSAGGAARVWRGTAAQSGAGDVTIRVEYAESPDWQGLARWRAKVWLFVAATDDRNSFASELSGDIDWHTGQIRATGVTVDGTRAGAPVELQLRLSGPQQLGILTLWFPASRRG